MELLLEKKKSEYMRCVLRGGSVCEENTEIIVSDKSPDIARIIKGAGSVFLREKEARGGKIAAEGNIRGAVFYVAEGEKNIRKLDVSMPFFCSAPADGISAESKIAVSANLRAFEVREINPRKVHVRASVEITYRVYEQSTSDETTGVTDKEKHGICERKGSFSDYRTVMLCEKNFSVTDDIEFSGEETDMSELLFTDARLIPTETKIIGNKSIVKGVAEISYLYTVSDGDIHSSMREIPFSQILDIDGMDEQDELDVTISVTGAGFDTQYDAAGEARYATVSVTAVAYAAVFRKVEGDILADAYSTMYDCEVERKSIFASRYIERYEKKVPVTESIETGSGVKRVIDVSVSVLPPVRRRVDTGEVISSDAAISVMYIGDNDEILSASRKIPVVCPIELVSGRTFEVSANTRGCGHSIGHNDEINVRFFVLFKVLETEEESFGAISAMSISNENADTSRRARGITIKRLSDTRDVWTLAKENKTTVAEISAANGIPEEGYVQKGKLLLIPR